MPDFDKMGIVELTELADQAGIPRSEETSTYDLIWWLDEDFHAAWSEALLEEHYKKNVDHDCESYGCYT
jgi:hypothetical protein